MLYLEKKSKVAGPVVWLVGGLHGDEPGGEAVIRTLFKKLETVELIRGSLHAFPLVNENGAEKKIRELPDTGEDLNRLFPGRLGGTLGEEIAHNIWQTIIVSKPNLVLDLHNDWINSIPYILIENDHSAPTALASGLIVVRENFKTLSAPERTLSGSLTKIGIPALTLELGGACVVDPSHRGVAEVDEKNVRIGMNAISRILCHLGLIDQEVFPNTQTSTGKLFNYSDEPKPTISGPIQIFVKSGQMVKKGDLIARIGNSEELFAGEKAVVLGFTDKTISKPDQEILAFGMES